MLLLYLNHFYIQKVFIIVYLTIILIKTKKCHSCNKIFKYSTYYIPKFCSLLCRGKINYPQCLNCNKRTNYKNSRYCSKKCYHSGGEKRLSKSYHDYNILYNDFIINNMTQKQIMIKYKSSNKTIKKYLNKFGLIKIKEEMLRKNIPRL